MKSKTTAALLAFFLGGIGAHRFYLGQVGKGFLYLIFCWTLIPGFIALIDFIIFLTMSEKNFNIKYNQEHLQYLYPQHQQPTVVINNHTGQYQPPAQPDYNRQHDRRAEHSAREQRRQPAPARQQRASATPPVDPFMKSGDEKYQEYDFDGAIKDYRRSLNVKSQNNLAHFRLACLYSITEQTDSAFFHLEKAVEQGFYDFDKIQSHDHLAFLRSQQPTFDMFAANGYKYTGTAPEPEDRLELSDEKVTQLERLAKMRDAGLLTDDEFKAQKVKILR